MNDVRTGTGLVTCGTLESPLICRTGQDGTVVLGFHPFRPFGNKGQEDGSFQMSRDRFSVVTFVCPSSEDPVLTPHL